MFKLALRLEKKYNLRKFAVDYKFDPKTRKYVFPQFKTGDIVTDITSGRDAIYMGPHFDREDESYIHYISDPLWRNRRNRETNLRSVLTDNLVLSKKVYPKDFDFFLDRVKSKDPNVGTEFDWSSVGREIKKGEPGYED